MRYFIIAGERSGDMHAAKLVAQLRIQDIRAEIAGIGGDYLQSEGVELYLHYQSFSVMGIIEVLYNLRKIRSTLHKMKKSIIHYAPDVLILVDFPGMNLKMATFAHKIGIKVCYYISPKIWAWREYRIKRIKRDIDKMFVILPFEVAYFKQKNLEVEYVGNPLLEEIRDHKFRDIWESNKTTIAILPGSRKQEIFSSAKIVREMASQRPQYHFIVAGVDNVDQRLYASYNKIENAQVLFNQTYDILKVANAAIVTSGTATLETALLNCPQVVVYKGNAISMFIARLLVKVKWISLVNLIADKQVVKELIQEDYTSRNVLEELSKILNDHTYCAEILTDYQEVRNKIGGQSASKCTAKSIVKWLQD